jgi:hypothetical protein
VRTTSHGGRRLVQGASYDDQNEENEDSGVREDQNEEQEDYV